MTSFSDLGLVGPLLKALAAEGYERPTPIQARTIPVLLEGRDLLGIAQTGTGKTAAFALPILQRLAADPKRAPAKGCRALILSPTRELARQIGESFRTYGRFMKVNVAVVFGGMPPGPQIRALQQGVDVLVATPGRLLDHMNTRAADLRATEIFVLDEADQMLDLGFIVPIRKLVKVLPAKRQNLFFSATMPSEIGKLAGELLRNPEQISVAPVGTTVERVGQRVLLIETAKKRSLLVELLGDAALSRVLVFTRTKHGADKVGQSLAAAGVVASVIHGNKSQGQRLRALEAFRAGQSRVLVATDIAARGIDIDGVSHVINFDLPDVPEAYVHRIGRTARAGASGDAIAFCDSGERHLLREIEKLTRQNIPSTDRRGPHAPEHHAEPRGQQNGHGATHARDSDHRRADHRRGKAPRKGGGQDRPHQNGKSQGKPNQSGKPSQGHGAKHHGGRAKFKGPRPNQSGRPEHAR